MPTKRYLTFLSYLFDLFPDGLKAGAYILNVKTQDAVANFKLLKF